MASELERIVRLEARVERVENRRQRVIDMLPLVVVLALLPGQVGWLWGVFQSFDDRPDRLEQGQAEILRRLPLEAGR
jgi:hypothetical protein